MPDETIHVKAGQEFSIRLKSFATAGYLWKIQALPDVIQLLGTKNEKPQAEMKPGDPNIQVFSLQAMEVGEYTIIFVLSRPWESQAMETRNVTVKAD